jgi:hypothetical protein
VLPPSICPVSGWKEEYHGGVDPRIELFLEKDEILRKEALRRRYVPMHLHLSLSINDIFLHLHFTGMQGQGKKIEKNSR